MLFMDRGSSQNLDFKNILETYDDPSIEKSFSYVFKNHKDDELLDFCNRFIEKEEMKLLELWGGSKDLLTSSLLFL